MLLKDDKKKMATIIVSKMKKGDDKMQKAPEHEGAELADSDELTMIADEVMQAIEKKDIRALRDSLKSMVEVAMNSEPEEQEESEEESESYED